MNDGLSDLYQEMVIDHSKHPRNYRVMGDATSTIEGQNPLCGDQLKLFLKVSGDLIEDLSFQGQGCAISKASASLLTATLKGKTKAEARKLFELVHRLVTEGPAGIPEEGLGKLVVLSGVSEFPARVKCASLAWHALRAALDGGETAISTE